MRYLFLYLIILIVLSFFTAGLDLQGLINSAPPNSTVYIPPGYYKGHLVIDKPLRIIGIGWPVIDGGGVGDVIYINHTWADLEGIIVVGSGRMTENAAIKAYKSWVILKNILINDSYHGVYMVESQGFIYNATIIGLGILGLGAEEFNPLYYEGGGYHHAPGFDERGHGIYLSGSSAIIEHCTVMYAKDGVYLDHAYNVVIRDNKALHGRYGTHLMYANNVEIVNNTFMYNLVGILLMFSDNLYVSGNKVLHNEGTYVSEGITLIEDDNVTIERNIIAFQIYGINVHYTPWRPSPFYVANNTILFNYYGAVFDLYGGGNFTGNIFLDNMFQLGATTNARLIYAKFSGNYWSDYVGDGSVPYIYVSPFSDLSETRHALRFFAFGPSAVLMQYMKLDLPVYARIEFIDPAPRRIQIMPTSLIFSYEFVVVGVILLMPLAVLWTWIRRWW